LKKATHPGEVISVDQLESYTRIHWTDYRKVDKTMDSS
jgi:hypothetical protein